METINVPKRKEGKAKKRVRVVVYRDSQKYILVSLHTLYDHHFTNDNYDSMMMRKKGETLHCRRTQEVKKIFHNSFFSLLHFISIVIVVGKPSFCESFFLSACLYSIIISPTIYRYYYYSYRYNSIHIVHLNSVDILTNRHTQKTH